MDLATFYNMYLTDVHLKKIGEQGTNLYKLIDEKIEEAMSYQYLSILSESLTPDEIELITRFSNFHHESNVQVVPFDLEKYPYLTFNHHLLFIGEDEGVIHEEVIDGILRSFGRQIELPTVREDIHLNNVDLNHAEYTTAVNLFEYPIIEYYNMLTREEQLYMIASYLNIEFEETTTRSQLINMISKHLTNRDVLKLILETMEEKERHAFLQKIEAGEILFTMEEYPWEEVMISGLVMPYQPGIAIINASIYDILKKAN